MYSSNKNVRRIFSGVLLYTALLPGIIPAAFSADNLQFQTVVSEDAKNLILSSRFGQIDVVQGLLYRNVNPNLRDEVGNTALISAAAENQIAVINLLINNGADVNAQAYDGRTSLITAARKGYLEVVKTLVDAGAQIDTRKINGDTALVEAIKYGHAHIIEFLLEKGADTNTTTVGKLKEHGGFTPLMYAAQHGLTGTDIDWVSIVDSLLRKGAKSDFSRANGDTALTIAQHHRHTSIIDRLLNEISNGNVDENGSFSKEHDLIKAVYLKDTAQAEALLKAEADPDFRDSNGVTPLLVATHIGDLGMLKLLVKYGVDINNQPYGLAEQGIAVSSLPYKKRQLMQTASRGDTALITATLDNNKQIVQFLLDQKADVNINNNDDEAPTLLAARYGYTEIMKLLLASGANPNMAVSKKKDNALISKLHKQNRLLLIEAIYNGHNQTAIAIIEGGADPDVVDNHDKSALMLAIEKDYTDVVNALLANKADINKANNAGKSPLMFAAHYGQQSTVKLLIDKGAHINAMEGQNVQFGTGFRKGGMTALMYASQAGHTDVVRMLKENGANVNLKAETGETALGMAKTQGYDEIVRILQAF